jgi:hypothetical protein
MKSLSFLRGMRNIFGKIWSENQSTHFMFNSIFFRKSCRLWDNVENTVDTDRPQMTIWRMRTACWIFKAKNTHTEYVMLIAFPPQQLLHVHAFVLFYTYMACPVTYWIKIISHGHNEFSTLCLLCFIFCTHLISCASFLMWFFSRDTAGSCAIQFLEHLIIYTSLLPDSFSDFEPRWGERGFLCSTPI